MRKLSLILLSLLIFLVGCTPKSSVKVETSPLPNDLSSTDTVAFVFDSIAKGEIDDANYYLKEITANQSLFTITGNKLSSGNLTEEDKNVFRKLFGDLTYNNLSVMEEDDNASVVSGEITLNGETKMFSLKLEKQDNRWVILTDEEFFAALANLNLSALID